MTKPAYLLVVVDPVSEPVGQALNRCRPKGDYHRGRRRREQVAVLHGDGGGGGITVLLVAPFALHVLELGAEVGVLLGLLLLDQVEFVVQKVVR